MHSTNRTGLLVLSDISSNTSGFKEPDDSQSLVRLLLYANDFNIEGLVATYTEHWHDCKPEYMTEIVQAYGKVREQLYLHDERYPQVDELLQVVKRGNSHDGLEYIGEGCDTEGSDWIISRVDTEDERPLWITVWGGTTELAQALWKVRHNRSAFELAVFIAKLRIYSISDQYGGLGAWIREQFPDLFYIHAKPSYRGVYKGGDPSLTSREWLETHITSGHGPLGEIYPIYEGGDPWGVVQGVKEGDTPSFLYMIPNGLGDPERPEYGSWGGRFIRSASNPNHFTDASDIVLNEGDRGEWTTVSRWRRAYQASFAARMDWCILPPGEGSYEPIAVLAGERVRYASPGDSVELDASGSMAIDGGELGFHWFVYREAGTFAGEVTVRGSDSPQASAVIADCELRGTVHIIVEVSNRSTPELVSYQRVIIEIN